MAATLHAGHKPGGLRQRWREIFTTVHSKRTARMHGVEDFSLSLEMTIFFLSAHFPNFISPSNHQFITTFFKFNQFWPKI
jgi:hypothetical protein